MERKELINPGGSLGDTDFQVPEFENFAELTNYMVSFHGYEVSNNLFFACELTGKMSLNLGAGMV